MSGGADPRIPETRRRRAETIAKSERVMTMSRSLTLTRSVLAEHIAQATPAQPDFVESWFEAELASREQSKRARLLKAAGLPNEKTLDGYDWSNLRMPPDRGRAQLEALEFVDGREDLVLHGPVGTGKSHLAVAPGRLACMNAVPVRSFTASGLLMRLRRARQENRLDRELAGIGKARLLIIDEFGYMPVDEEGSRLLFQAVSDSYETRSIIHATNIESGGWGPCSATRTWPPRSSTAPSTTAGSSDSRADPTAASTPSRPDKPTNDRQEQAAGRPHAEHAENTPPKPRKKTAHNADVNLPKHT